MAVQPVHFVGYPSGPPVWLRSPVAARLLAHGTKFIPTPGKFDSVVVEDTFDKFARSCHFRLYFGDEAMTAHTAQFRVPNPTFELPRHVMNSPAHVQLSAQLAALRERLVPSFRRVSEYVAKSRKFVTNVSIQERRVLQRLRAETSLVIKPADKNLGLCVISREWYLSEGLRQLASPNYRATTGFNIADMCSLLKGFLDTHKGHINALEYKWLVHALKGGSHKLPTFYMLPKLHKSPVVGRPIVASCAWVFAPLSQWLSFHLNPVVQTMDTVLVSTAALVTDLQSITLPPTTDVHLVSADVSDMYNNIPVSQAILAVGGVVRRRFPSGLAGAIVDALGLVLNNNYFTFDGVVYHQTSGIAMGTSCAPPLAQLFMALLEQDLRTSLRSGWPAYYKRYIDDALVVFFGPLRELERFLNALQQLHQNLRWTFTVSRKAVTFLDLNIWIDQRKQLGYSAHSKALNAFQYIPRFSFHPPATARGWILTELYRIRRNSSTELARLRACLHFFRRLRARGHTAQFLTAVFGFEDSQHQQPGSNDTAATQYMVMPFNRAASIWPYRQIIRDWHASISKDFFKTAPAVAFSTSASLGRMVIRAQLPLEDIEISLSDDEWDFEIDLSEDEEVLA